MRAPVVSAAALPLLLLLSIAAGAPEALADEQPEEELEATEQPDEEEEEQAPSAPSISAEQGHAQGRRDHVLAVMRIDSAIENLNDGTVQVFGTRREFLCPTGELVAERACSPCLHQSAEWGVRPSGIWLHEAGWRVGDERGRAEALARLEHLRRYFELVPRGGVESGGRRASLFEYTGRLKPPPEPPRATRVRFFVDGAEVSAAVIAAGRKTIALEARAQAKGENGSLVEYPEAKVEFASACGDLQQTAPGRALFSMRPMVARCEVRATATPGSASAAIGIRRELEVEIIYEGQAADRMLLEGTASVELGLRAIAGGAEVRVAPEWKARGATLELLEGGRRVKVRLEQAASQAEISLLDRDSGAGDTLVLERKKPN